MYFTWFGIVIDSNLLHPQKALRSILVIVSGSIIDYKLEQY